MGEIESTIYFAGLFDGEGSVFIRTSRGIPTTIVITVSNTDPRLMTWIKATFGGEYYEAKRKKLPRKEKRCWYWTCNSRLAILILKKVLPYLIVKKEQAELAIAYSEIKKDGVRRRKGMRRHDKSISEADILQRKYFQNRIKELKHCAAAEINQRDSIFEENGDVMIRTLEKSKEVAEMTTRQQRLGFLN